MTNPKSIFKIMPNPPDELVQVWCDTSKYATESGTSLYATLFAAKAALWGQQQRDKAIKEWFQQNTSEDLLHHLQEQATCILNEMFAARDLARAVRRPAIHRKAMKQTLEQLLRLVETHIRMEDLRKASSEVSGQ